jgi:hypothetical protein
MADGRRESPVARFVPPEFEPPRSVELGRFVLRALGPEHVDSDYAALMGSASRLNAVFAEHHAWPQPTLTRSENEHDLRRHAAEFTRRLAFAYNVVRLSQARRPSPPTVGCVYINPATRRGFDAECFMWTVSHDVGARELATLSTDLERVVVEWLEREWPFSSVAFPARRLRWSEFDALPWRDEAIERISMDACSVVTVHARASGLLRSL